MICLNKNMTSELKDTLFTSTQKWLEDPTVYFTSNSGEKKLIGEKINTSRVILSRNHVYCEYWYCLLFIKRLIKERLSIDLREILPESLQCKHFRNRLLQVCLKGNLVINLNRANLSMADLSRIVLYRGDLRSAFLLKTKLVGTDLRKANLKGADLSAANLCAVNLSEADLSNADLKGVILSMGDLSGVKLNRSCLVGAMIDRTPFKGADLEDADLRGALLHNIDFNEVNFSGVNLRMAQLYKVKFTNSNLLDAANLSGTIFENVICDEKTLLQAEKRGAIIKKKP